MKYRGKLLVSFVFLIFISTLVAVGILYRGSKSLLFEQIRSEIFSIGLTSAELLNGSYIGTINEIGDTKTTKYTDLVNTLRLIRNSNRRENFFVDYVLLFKRIGENKYIYIADAEEDPKKESFFGEPVQFDKDEVNFDPRFPYVDSVESVDQWGRWLSGFFPIYNTNKEIVAYVEIDLNFASIIKKLDRLLLYGGGGFFISLFLGFFVATFFAKKMTKDLNAICKCVEDIASGNLDARISLNNKDEIGELGNKINAMAKQLKEKERITTSFSKYVSRHILEKITSTESVAKLEGETRKITVLFSDIRSFTAISESVPPEEIVSFLNDYFEKMIDIVFKHQGTLDKFMGDGMMAEFGAPLDDVYQELNAITAAIKMQKMIEVISEKWKGTKYEHIKIGIGIHTGFAVVGNIGSSQRMEYTAIGDTVNIASRLELATEEMRKDILISKETYEAIKSNPNLVFEYIGPVHLRGRLEPIVVYSVGEKIEPMML